MNKDFAELALGCFFEISKIPRGSGNERAASDFLVEFAERHGCEAVQDEYFNVLVRKPGSVGRENEPAVILQNHIDMVCEKNAGTEHDFLKDPIIPIIDGDWVFARGTTLGADNGAGMAAAMAVIASTDISHPPIEAVFTTDEEVGMIGAANFDAALLKGNRLINLDSGADAAVTVGCAASADVDITIPIKKQSFPANHTALELTVKGLVGGHSGVDIHKGFANANVLMARLLKDLFDYNGIFLSTINGGAQRNAIPRECFAIIACKEDHLDTVIQAAESLETTFRAEFPKEPDLTIIVNPSETGSHVMTAETFGKILNFITTAPNGVLAMSAHIDGLVQTSTNQGVVITGENDVKILIFPRSSSSTEQAETISKYLTLAESLDIKARALNEKPPWEYREESPLRDIAADILCEIYGSKPEIMAIHAGLECGIFLEKIPGADAIALGPLILGAHSPDEKMSLVSFNNICEFLVRILGKI